MCVHLCSFKACSDESCLQRQDKLHHDTKHTLEDCRHPAAHKGVNGEMEGKMRKRRKRKRVRGWEIEADKGDMNGESAVLRRRD